MEFPRQNSWSRWCWIGDTWHDIVDGDFPWETERSKLFSSWLKHDAVHSYVQWSVIWYSQYRARSLPDDRSRRWFRIEVNFFLSRFAIREWDVIKWMRSRTKEVDFIFGRISQFLWRKVSRRNSFTRSVPSFSSSLHLRFPVKVRHFILFWWYHRVPFLLFPYSKNIRVRSVNSENSVFVPLSLHFGRAEYFL